MESSHPDIVVPQSHSEGSRGHALVLGIDRYPHLAGERNLRGAVADARAMADYLRRVRGLPDRGVRLLLDDEATGPAVSAGMEWLLRAVRPGEPAIFFFAGHGGWRGDGLASTRRADGIEKLLLLHDSPDPPRGAGAYLGRPKAPERGFPGGWLGGDVLAPWLRDLTARTADVTVILDCCYSGTATRDAATCRVRGVMDEPPPAPYRSVPSRGLPTFAGAAGRDVAAPAGAAAPYVLATACRSDQEAAEDVWEPGGVPRGLFTWSLLRHLHRAAQLGLDVSWQDLMDEVAADAASRLPRQVPQLEGARERRLFALGEAGHGRYVQVVTRREDRVVLSAGSLHRVAEGSQWRVLPGGLEGAQPPGSEERRGRVRVESVEGLSCHARIEEEEPAGWIGPRDRAVLAAQPAPDHCLAVELEPPPDEGATDEGTWQLHRRLAEAVARSPFLRLVDPGGSGIGAGGGAGEDGCGDARVILLPAAAGHASPTWALVDRRGDLLCAPKRVSADGMDAVLENLDKTARHHRLLRLRNGASSLAGAIRLDVLRPGAGGGWRKADPWEVYRPGDAFALRICNDSPHLHLFVYVLGLGFSGSISLLYPLQGAWQPLKPGRCVEWGNRPDLPLKLTLPGGWPYLSPSRAADADAPGRRADVLKLLVTTHPTDYRLFFQESRRTGAEAALLAGRNRIDDLGATLAWFVLGAGLRGSQVEEPVSADWTTLERWLWLEV